MAEPAVHYEVCPNGLTLLLRETHLAPVVELQFWVGVGSADERPDELGLAHFHEHMLFKGTETRTVGDVAGEVEGAGGRINAYTSFDVTVYYATLPTGALDTGIEVLVDALRHSVFDEAELRQEVEVVLEEIRRSDDSPPHVLGDAVFREAYQVHPYRSPILGPPSSVERFDRERVTRFFSRWYTPDNISVVAAGDFDAAALATRLKDAFADAAPGDAKRKRPSEPAQSHPRVALLRRPFERARLDLSWHAPSFRHPDAIHLDLFSFILGECDSSRLVRRVKEREGLADRIDSSSYTPLDPGLFSVNIEVDCERAPAAIEAAVAEVERLRRQAVSEDEIERARANFLSSEHFERESVSGMAHKLGSFQVLGGSWRNEEAYFAAIRKATPADLLRVAREHLDPARIVVGALVPEDANGAAVDEDGIRSAVVRGRDRIARAFAPPARETRASDVERFELESGAKLFVRPRRDVPVVAARAAFMGGLLADTEEAAGLTAFLSSMWMRGTASRSTADYARAVEALAADIDSFAGRNSLGVVLEVTRDKLEPALDLFTEPLLGPLFDDAELERERKDALASIERREDRLAQRAYLLFGETLFRTHPYRLPMVGHRESVEAFDAEKVRAHHARLVRADNLVIGVSGDVDPEEIARAVSIRLSELPTGATGSGAGGAGGAAAAGGAGERLALPPPEDAPTEIRIAELHKDRAQAHMVLGFQGLTVLDPERRALEVLSQLLAGQGGRLFLELRDRQGLAYAVSAGSIEGVAPGFFSVYIATAPEKVDQARTGMLTELERVLSDPVSDDELARAKRYLCGSFAIDRQRNAAHAAQLALDGLYGLSPDADLRYTDEIEAVTADDLLRVARRVLRLDAYTLAIIRPA